MDWEQGWKNGKGGRVGKDGFWRAGCFGIARFICYGRPELGVVVW